MSGHLIHPQDWPLFRRLMRDYRAGRLKGSKAGPRRKQAAGRPPIRCVLLDALDPSRASDDVQADAAVTELALDNEQQQVRVCGTPTGGSYKLRWRAEAGAAYERTAAIPWDATAAELQELLLALSFFQEGDLEVTAFNRDREPDGKPSDPDPQPLWYLVRFTGQYAGRDVPLLEPVEEDLDGPSGATAPRVEAVATTVWADTGRIETVRLVLPLPDGVRLPAGTVVLAHWYHGIGYGIHAAECRACEDDLGDGYGEPSS